MNNKNIFFSPWAYLITNCILKHLTQFTADQHGSAQLGKDAFTTLQSFCTNSILHSSYIFYTYFFFRYIIETMPDVLAKELKMKVLVRIDSQETIVGDDNWIFEANCMHLAANFMPEGLDLILSNANDPKKLVHLENLHKLSPLHIAARNNDSLSTR